MFNSRYLLLLQLIIFVFAAPAFPQVAKPHATASKTHTELDRLIDQREYPELEHRMTQVKLDAADQAYFEGVLANRKNELQKSISLLEDLPPKLKASSGRRAAAALRALADDYVKTFRYADADRTYSQLLADFIAQFPSSERKSLKDDAQTVRLLKGSPPQTIELNGSFTLPTHRSPIGTIESDLTVNGVTKSWILDTGANYSVLTESAARQMHLNLSEGTAKVQGSAGAETPLHIAIIPEFKIGPSTVKNVVALVLPDASLTIPLPKGKHQIEAILGYPVLSAFGQVTWTSDEHVTFSSGGQSSGAPIYMQQLDPLLQVRVHDRDLLMMFDTGADHTSFTARYYDTFQPDFEGLEKKTHMVGGAGGIKKISVYELPSVAIAVGDTTITLKNVAVSTEKLGTDGDLLFGRIGRDLTAEFKSFTFDFKNMRLRLEK